MLKSFSPSEDLYICVCFVLFFLHRPKWKHKIEKKKILGTNGYINMILFVKIAGGTIWHPFCWMAWIMPMIGLIS